jgi:hypothetical protein
MSKTIIWLYIACTVSAIWYFLPLQLCIIAHVQFSKDPQYTAQHIVPSPAAIYTTA